MTHLVVAPELVQAAATDFATLGSTLEAAHVTAVPPTTAVLPMAADEVSESIARWLSSYGQEHQTLAGRAAAFLQRFVQNLNADAGTYAAGEAAAAAALENIFDPGLIYRTIQRTNEQLLINFTNLVGQLEQPIAPLFEDFFASPVPPPTSLPTPINGAVSLIVFGTGYNVLPPDLLALTAQVYGLPGGFGALWQPNQFFPITPHFGDLTVGQSIGQGAQLLAQAIQAELSNNATQITVWANSLSSTTATLEIRHLMSMGSPLQNELEFILTGNPNNPDGGIAQRFAGLYIPGLDIYLNGATPPNSPYPTKIYSNQYDMISDFPQYVLNPVSTINSVIGYFLGAHLYVPADVATAIQLPTSPGYDGETTYYRMLHPNLPLVEPLRRFIGGTWANAIADLLQPNLRVLVDLGYASGNYADIPTPGQFFQLPNPFTIIPYLAQGTIQGATAFAVDLGWLPPSMMPTTYPFTPLLDPQLNFPIGQYSVTGLSLITGAEGQLMRSLGLIPSWWD